MNRSAASQHFLAAALSWARCVDWSSRKHGRRLAGWGSPKMTTAKRARSPKVHVDDGWHAHAFPLSVNRIEIVASLVA